MGNVLGGLFGGGGGKDAAKASIAASETQAEAQREALDYLKEVEAVPRQYREGALGALGDFYGLGGADAQQSAVTGLQASPIYQAIMGGREAGEESILRNQAATGGLRSGNTQEALYDYNTQLQNQAMLQAYQDQIGGLGGLAGLQSYAPQIASGTAGIGQTLAQGQVAAAQAKQAGSQQGFGNLMGLGQLGLQAYSAFSDPRLKSDISPAGTRNGYPWYTWTWNKAAEAVGLKGKGEGVMATEVEDWRLGEHNGYLTVNMEGII